MSSGSHKALMISVTFLCCCGFTSHLWLHDPYDAMATAYNLPHRYNLYLPLHSLWIQYMEDLLQVNSRYMHICVYVYTYTCMYVLMYINVCIATYVCICTSSCYKFMIYQTDNWSLWKSDQYDYHYFYYIQSSNYYIILRYTKIN